MAWGSFAGGLAEGLEGGVGMADKLRQLNDAARVRAARKALGTAYGSDMPMSDGSAPPMPGATPVPITGTPPLPGVASQPKYQGSTSPDPMMGGPDPLAAIGANAGAPAPPQAVQALPPPVAAPAAPAAMPATVAAPATGAGGDPMSGVAAPVDAGAGQEQQLTSTITDANNTIKAIAAQVRKANPNIDPETLFEATRQHIENMKGVRNEVKDYMTTQVEYAKIQQRMQGVIERVAGQQGVADTRAGVQRDVANTNAASRETVGAGHDDARVEAARLTAAAHAEGAVTAASASITRAQIMAAASNANARTRLEGTLESAATRAGALADSARVAAKARVEAMIAGAGGEPDRSVAPMPAKKSYIGADGQTVAPKPAAAPAMPAGAKKAPDGHWYTPDPARPGKYLMVG